MNNPIKNIKYILQTCRNTKSAASCFEKDYCRVPQNTVLPGDILAKIKSDTEEGVPDAPETPSIKN